MENSAGLGDFGAAARAPEFVTVAPVGSGTDGTVHGIGGGISNLAAASSALAPSFLKTAKHPTICMVHISFKLASLLT